jgi:aerobic-type carbon monoxide dehydrogenase small subunit (CoxS/CutS family)
LVCLLVGCRCNGRHVRALDGHQQREKIQWTVALGDCVSPCFAYMNGLRAKSCAGLSVMQAHAEVTVMAPPV